MARLRFEHRHLEDLVALLLAPGEALVKRSVQEAVVDLEHGQASLHEFQEIEGVELGFAPVAALTVERAAQELGVRHAGNLDRVLEGQEDAGAGTRLGAAVAAGRGPGSARCPG
jgi:hypothetical protein